jgi:cell division protein FtsN
VSPRDYKHSAPRAAARDAGPQRFGSWISFVSGLGLGLMVAFAVYLWSAALPRPAALVGGPEQPVAPEPAPPAASDAMTAAPDFEPPRPKFDFYKILPEMEVPVQEWASSDGGADPAAALEQGAYVLQVGSFKSFEDADRAKAKLALNGVSASVQRVVINGQDVWFRVHVGPLSDAGALHAMRVRLAEIDVDYILLRIGGPTIR